MDNSKHILFSCPYGYALRNIALTNIAEGMHQRGWKTSVLSSFDKNDLKEYPGYDTEKINYYPYQFNPPLYKIIRLFHIILTTRLYNITENQTYKIMWDNYRATNKKLYILSRLAGWPLPKSKEIYKALVNLFNWLVIRGEGLNHKKSPFIEDQSPDIIVSTVPFFPLERYILEKYRRNTLTVGFPLSWDNITAKGRMVFDFDYYIVWNDIMKKQLMDIYNIKPERIAVVGIPQMDIYTDKNVILPREKFLNKLGVESDVEKIILYATSFSGFAEEFQFVKSFMDTVLPKIQRYKCRVIVRHRNYSEKFKEFFKNIDVVMNYGCKNIRLTNKDHQRIFYDMDDMIEYANLIYHSDVVINAASTVTLDAVFFNKPIINIAFDGHEEKEYSKSIRRIYDYVHYRDVVQTGGLKIVYNFDELRKALQDYLDDPSIDYDKRLRLQKEQIKYLDGKSAERCVGFLDSLIKG